MDFFNEAFKIDPAKTWAEEIEIWKTAAANSRSREIDLNLRLVELDYEKSRLELKVAALVRLLVETRIVDPEKLESMMDAIDAEDGIKDGRVTPDGDHRTPFVPADH